MLLSVRWIRSTVQFRTICSPLLKKNFLNTLLSASWIISFSIIVVRTDSYYTLWAPGTTPSNLSDGFFPPTSGNFLTHVPWSVLCQILKGALYRSLGFSVQLFPFWNSVQYILAALVFLDTQPCLLKLRSLSDSTSVLPPHITAWKISQDCKLRQSYSLFVYFLSLRDCFHLLPHVQCLENVVFLLFLFGCWRKGYPPVTPL